MCIHNTHTGSQIIDRLSKWKFVSCVRRYMFFSNFFLRTCQLSPYQRPNTIGQVVHSVCAHMSMNMCYVHIHVCGNNTYICMYIMCMGMCIFTGCMFSVDFYQKLFPFILSYYHFLRHFQI